jgi:hypothetical protein
MTQVFAAGQCSICKELLIGLLGAVGTAGLLHYIGRL